MATKLQLQWRTREGGEWRYHSTPDAQSAQAMITHYLGRHGSRSIFDYRVVEPSSSEALAKHTEDYSPNGQSFGTFRFNR